MIPGQSRQLYQEATRFIRGEPRQEPPSENFPLPGQPPLDSPPMAGNYPNNLMMNVSWSGFIKKMTNDFLTFCFAE